jgi:hypothetical protein
MPAHVFLSFSLQLFVLLTGALVLMKPDQLACCIVRQADLTHQDHIQASSTAKRQGISRQS